jgi:hypothetical protein
LDVIAARSTLAFGIFPGGINSMRLGTWSLTLLLLAGLGCKGNAQNFKLYELPSGKEIKVTGVVRMDFPDSDAALVMKLPNRHLD